MIEWIAPALGSPATFSVVSLADKAILSRLGLSSSGLTLFVGANQLLVALIVLAAVPLDDAGPSAVAGGLAAGMFQGLGLSVMFFVLKRQDVSRVIPIFQTSPIFVALLALAFLDESLGALQWIAVVLAVAGAILAAMKRSEIGTFRPDPAFAVLFIAAASIAASQILIKTTTDDVSIWNAVSLRGFGMGATILVIFGRPRTLRELAKFFTVGRRSGAFLIASESLLAVAASIQLVVAIALGPVSLAAALLGTRPLFIFGGSLAMSRLAPGLLGEVYDAREFALKFAATGMIVAAIILIAVG